MEDQKIIELIKSQKHAKVFTTLYNYFPVVKKMVLANGGRSEDAEDLYQDALIVFYKKAGSADFTLTSTINTYLYSICRFMWKDQLKKQNKQSFTDIEKEAVDEIEFIAAIETEDQLKLAEKVISELGGRCKELLILFYFHSIKLKDIAAKMGYNSENTAKNQKYKCLESAKIKLKALQTSH
ncbi:MAG TPA: sigma-70 family RNA polymerase sigma factor [Bacteroidia bacterium]|jgi:RNA polymerase sigma factor (sigma-70 family)